MTNYKLTIEYDGSRYRGWQRLKDNQETIQGKLEGVLSKLLEEEIEVIGSGRTDAGVHALAQVANFKTTIRINPKELLADINRYLPEDIVVRQVELVEERFHSRYNAAKKKYRYKIWHNPIPSALLRKYTYHYPDKLDIDAMVRGSKFLIGKHDFIAMSSIKKINKSTIREIYNVDIIKKDNLVEIVITGNGFLYNMMRIIVGTLLKVGAGEIQPQDIEKILSGKDRQLAGETVPAYGLYLEEVTYN